MRGGPFFLALSVIWSYSSCLIDSDVRGVPLVYVSIDVCVYSLSLELNNAKRGHPSHRLCVIRLWSQIVDVRGGPFFFWHFQSTLLIATLFLSLSHTLHVCMCWLQVHHQLKNCPSKSSSKLLLLRMKRSPAVSVGKHVLTRLKSGKFPSSRKTATKTSHVFGLRAEAPNLSRTIKGLPNRSCHVTTTTFRSMTTEPNWGMPCFLFCYSWVDYHVCFVLCCCVFVLCCCVLFFLVFSLFFSISIYLCFRYGCYLKVNIVINRKPARVIYVPDSEVPVTPVRNASGPHPQQLSFTPHIKTPPPNYQKFTKHTRKRGEVKLLPRVLLSSSDRLIYADLQDWISTKLNAPCGAPVGQAKCHGQLRLVSQPVWVGHRVSFEVSSHLY